MIILIDARLYGPEHTGNGRYTMNLISELTKLDKKNKYLLLLRKKYYKKLKLPPNWTKILADFKHYSLTEQIKLPFIINKSKPDLVHFPHFNIPIFYFGKYIVTIHDMTMHKFRGKDATTRKLPLYQLWRLGYYLSFAKAVYGSKRIIVPSEAVKQEILSFYKVNQGKVKVVYE
ncbi:glycosyltransferase [Patescibacteria group bacterium]